MSLITRCPACTTMFRVVPDQLRVSGGWVRCGHCQEVFDASANLQPATLDAGASGRDSTSSPTVESDTARPNVAQRAPAATPPVQSQEPFLDVNPGALDLNHHDVAEPSLDAEVASETVPDAAALAVDDIAMAADLVPTPHPATPSFVSKHAPQKRSRWATAGWASAACGLVLTLAVQVVVHERDRLAATEPATLAVLAPLCEHLGCTLAPYRQIEAVVIESSAFSRLRGDVYRLAVTYKNTAAVPIEAPALELTLTDLQDQPVVRKVFTRKELGLPRATLEATSEQAMSVPVALKAAGTSDKISGYRLLAFYP